MQTNIGIKEKLSQIPKSSSSSLFPRLIELGISLSIEKNKDRLMETILLEAKSICNADGGTLYLATQDKRLRFAIMRTDSLNIAMGGTTNKAIPFAPLPLYDSETGAPNHHNIATHVALTGETVNIKDAYTEDKFDFSGTRKFDSGTGYRSKSFLTVPLKNHQGKVAGVMQLLNARDKNGKIIPFSLNIQPIIESLASQAAVALDNQSLIESQKKLLEAFIKVIAYAIDQKSRYTGGHCARVPELNQMIAQAACEEKDGPFKDFHLSEEEWYELRIAGWLHDCGKVITPEAVMDKGTKLEKIHDRISEIEARIVSLKNELQLEFYKNFFDDNNPFKKEKKAIEQGAKKALDQGIKGALDQLAEKVQYRETKDFLDGELEALDSELEFLKSINIGGEWLNDSDVERLRRISERQWTDARGIKKPLLNDEEIYNLSIRRGTLTPEERQQINDHVVVTIEMLQQLPFPENLKRVPEYAGGHHEKMDGTGYPNKLTGDKLSVPAKMLALSDIFEALTAADRPYKKAKPLSESLKILENMVKGAHIDPDIYELFIRHKIYLQYANKFLRPEQIDID